MEAERGPPKKKRKTQSSIIPVEDVVTTHRMVFPSPSENSAATIEAPLETISIEYHAAADENGSAADAKKSKGKKMGAVNKAKGKKPAANNKAKGKKQADGNKTTGKKSADDNKTKEKKKDVGVKGNTCTLLDSPAMSTRSKMMQPASPAMCTKRRLSL